MKHRIDLLIDPKAIGVFIPLALSIVLCCLAFFMMPESLWVSASSSQLDSMVAQLLNENPVLSHGLGWLFTLLCAFLLMQLNESYSFISVRTLLPFFFYIALMGANVYVHAFTLAQVSSVFVVLALGQLFSMYRQPEAVRSSFDVGFFLSIAGLFCIDVVCLIPAFWIGMQRINNFSLRSFLANILGLLSPIVLLFGIVFLYSESAAESLLVDYANCYVYPSWSVDFSFVDYLFFIALFICSVFSIIGIVNHSYNDNIKGSRMLGIVAFLFFFCTLMFLFLPTKIVAVYPFSLLFSSLLLAHFFTMNNGVVSKILFYILMACGLLFFLDTIIFR